MIDINQYLEKSFYARDTATVARELLGKYLIRRRGADKIVCRIVETEAYYGKDDPASHAARGPTPRSAVMFGPPGRAYIYFNYGVHHMFNVVTEAEETAGAVLIRALEPVAGIEAMRRYRVVNEIYNLSNGPGKLTKALRIDLSDNGRTLTTAALGILSEYAGVDGGEDEIVSGPRIGISAGRELPYRFFIKDNKFVSKRP